MTFSRALLVWFSRFFGPKRREIFVESTRRVNCKPRQLRKSLARPYGQCWFGTIWLDIEAKSAVAVPRGVKIRSKSPSALIS